MCEDCKCEHKEEVVTPTFDMLDENKTNDEIGLQIIASIEKIAQGVLTLQQELVLMNDRIEAHEAHISYILSKDPDFKAFLAQNADKMKAAVAAQETSTKE